MASTRLVAGLPEGVTGELGGVKAIEGDVSEVSMARYTVLQAPWPNSSYPEDSDPDSWYLLVQDWGEIISQLRVSSAVGVTAALVSPRALSFESEILGVSCRSKPLGIAGSLP